MLYHPVLPGLARDPAKNPAGYRNPAEWQMPYNDIEVSHFRIIRINSSY